MLSSKITNNFEIVDERERIINRYCHGNSFTT